MAPQYGAGSCCGFGWWGGSIQLRFRHSDLCHSSGLSWFDFFMPAEAQAALDALNANKAPITAREAVELLKLKKALQAKVEGR